MHEKSKRKARLEPERERSGSRVDAFGDGGERSGHRFLAVVLVALASLVMGAHLLGAGPLTGVLWGSHTFAFFPVAILVLGMAALAATTLAVTFALRRPIESGSMPPRWLPWVMAGVAAVLFWLARAGHTLLGDGNVLVKDLPLGLATHPHQPLTVFLHQKLYAVLGWLFDPASRPGADVARDTVAMSSAIAGAFFVLVAFALARAILRSTANPRLDRTANAMLLTGLFLAQGYVQLFFGYVENYTFFALAIGLYLLTAIHYLQGRTPLFVAGLAWVLALGLHLSAALLLPSLGVLVAVGLRRARGTTLRDLAITLLGIAALQLGLALIQPGFSLATQLADIFGMAARGHGEAGRLAYLLSGEHWRDFFNEQFLIGPLAAFLFVPVALYGLVRGTARTATAVFFLVAAAAALGSAWLTTELNLGYARDWDLFAPYGVVYLAAALVCVVPLLASASRARSFLVIAVLVSVFHTAPWITLNTSFERSFERLKTLPLGRGRTEATVGYWYLTHEQPDSARAWFDRSIEAHPSNNLAHYSLGVIALDDNRHDDALRHLTTAVRLRPDKNEYRIRLADALVVARRPDAALPHLRTLTARDPGRASYWACLGLVLLGLERTAPAYDALQRATALEPDDPLYRELRDNLGEPGLYEAAIEGAWVEIATR